MTEDDPQKALEKALPSLRAAVEKTKFMARRVDVDQGLVRLTRDEVVAKPDLVREAFITVLIHLPYERMTELQRRARLAFVYDNEVQSGGHVQFLVNTEAHPEGDTVAALEALSLPAHADLLRRAYARWRAQKEEFFDLDREYQDLRPTITDELNALLERHQDDFVWIRGARTQ